jgi:nitroimidazol reductase NimA-like FMN-containing flavoprotein (pyridoxamine 5'-phosphate oxidase superfamily)
VNRDERKEFVANHRTAVFGYRRNNDGPAMSIVYYVLDEGDFLVSTMAERSKAKAVQRDPKVSLCVLDENWPPTYLLVYCDAKVDTDFEANVDLGMRIAGLMAGEPMPDDVRPLVAEGVKKENRVILRCTPYGTFATPPRHVHSADDVNENLTHEVGNTISW